LKRRAERDLERARGSERTQEVRDEERGRKKEGKQAKVAVEASRCLTTEMRRNLAPGELGWEKKGWWGGSRKLFQHENGSSGRVKGRRMLVVWVKKRERAFGRAHLPLSFLSKDSHHASSLFFLPSRLDRFTEYPETPCTQARVPLYPLSRGRSRELGGVELTS